MNFIAILTVFLMLWRWGSFSILQQDAWFIGMVKREAPVTGGYWLYGVSVLLPVLFVLACVIAFHEKYYGLVHFILAILILAYSLGRLPLHTLLHSCRVSWRDDSPLEWTRAITTLVPESNHVNKFGQFVDVREAYVYAAFQGLFAVLFWFVLLGPAGALLYRLTVIYTANNTWQGAAKIQQYLEWPAAILASLTFVLVGNFDKGMASWLSTVMNRGMSVKNIVHANALAAQNLDMHWLLMDENNLRDERVIQQGDDELQGLMVLVRRGIIFAVFIIAIFQIVM